MKPQQPIAEPLPDRATIQHLTHDLETRTRGHFAAARQELAPTLGAFADAYERELKRLREQALDDDEDADLSAVRVPLHWLVLSGWKLRVEVALQRAAGSAAQRSLADLTQYQRHAVQQGSQEAQRQIQRAAGSAAQRLVERHRRG